MRKGDKRIFFNQPKKLREMLSLREQGWSLLKLGRKYGVNHTTILYQIRKNAGLLTADWLEKRRERTRDFYKKRLKEKELGELNRKGFCSLCGIRLTAENISDCSFKNCPQKVVDNLNLTSKK